MNNNYWAKEQLTQEQAIAFYHSGLWKAWTADQIVRFQLFQQKLAMDFSDFHRAVVEVLGRGVFTHEFSSSNVGNLQAEYLGEKEPPTLQEIINLIPEEKRITLNF